MAQDSFLERKAPVDFLYLDKARVSSLIGQLSDRGVLTGRKEIISKSQGNEGSAGASVGVAKADGKRSTIHAEASEETYDPFWTHAYSFLQALEADFAVPIETARMGCLIKFNGFVQFLDLKILRNLWEPSAKAFLVSQQPQAVPAENVGSRKERRERRLDREAQSTIPENVKAGLAILKEVPHLLQMFFLSRDGLKFWAAAQPEYLTISTEHLVMKYGPVIDGIWTILGIVDGRVGDAGEPFRVSPILDSFITATSTLRSTIGRPNDHWGITPIAIYSEIRGIAEVEALEGAQDLNPPSGNS